MPRLLKQEARNHTTQVRVLKGFRVQGLGFRVQGSGFRVWGLGFRVSGRYLGNLPEPQGASGSSGEF